ncbi:MAG: hypothetical protein U1E53_14865 [Dongiaceae bacterium]
MSFRIAKIGGAAPPRRSSARTSTPSSPTYGNAPEDDPLEPFRVEGATVKAIGDALCPRTVEEAVLEGLRAGAGLD